MIDGEVVAFDERGRPAFNILQNYGSAKAPLFYYVFDLMMGEGKDVTDEPLLQRRQLLERRVLSHLRSVWTAVMNQVGVLACG